MGDNAFDDMVILDDGPIKNSLGVASARDCVQFVPFKDYENDITELTKKVLEELPCIKIF